MLHVGGVPRYDAHPHPRDPEPHPVVQAGDGELHGPIEEVVLVLEERRELVAQERVCGEAMGGGLL